MRPIDWTLLTIGQSGVKPLEPVQLQKALFLLGKNLSSTALKTDQFYQFDPYDYGPFCAAVYRDADELADLGLIAVEKPPISRFKLYSVTDSGRAKCAALGSQLSSTSVDYLAKVVTFTQSLSFNELVEAIYHAYPEMRANSVFQPPQ